MTPRNLQKISSLYVPSKYTVFLQRLGIHKKNETASGNCILSSDFSHGSQYLIFLICCLTFDSCCWIWVFVWGFYGLFCFKYCLLLQSPSNGYGSQTALRNIECSVWMIRGFSCFHSPAILTRIVSVSEMTAIWTTVLLSFFKITVISC